MQVVRDSLGLLVSLMGAWVAILDEIARGEIAEVSLPGTLRFDLPRIEGAALACLCSCHPEVSYLLCPETPGLAGYMVVFPGSLGF